MRYFILNLLVLTILSSANAVICLTVVNIEDNIAWPTTPALPAFVVDDGDIGTPGSGIPDNGNFYDARALRIETDEPFQVQSVKMILDTTGSFDDSLAIDFDPLLNNGVDFVSTQDDAFATSGIGRLSDGAPNAYTPWIASSAFQLEATITTTGTTLRAFWNGVEINVGTGDQYFNEGNPLFPGDPGFNNASSFTLEDWGFAANGSVDAGVFTTNAIRLGSLNTDQIGGHDLTFTFSEVEITDADNNVYVFNDVPAIPEPRSYVLFTGLLAMATVLIQRVRSE